MHGFDDRRDLLFGFYAGRIEAIGAGFGVGLQTIDHHGKIGLPDQKTFAASGQQHVALVGIDRRARRLDALDREVALVKRLGGIAGGILDRQSGDAGLDRARDIGADLLRLVREAALEIGVDGQIDRGADRGEMIADLIERDAIVSLADRPGKTRAGRGERLEAEMLQRLGAADVERIGQHETSGSMHLVERRALIGCRDRHGLSRFICIVAQR